MKCHNNGDDDDDDDANVTDCQGGGGQDWLEIRALVKLFLQLMID